MVEPSPPTVKFGLEFVPTDACWKAAYYAIMAEKSGFDYVWVTDRHKNRNVYVVLTTIAMNTERIRFGPGVTNPYLVHPIVTAQALASLSELARGRVVCGVGAGDKIALDSVMERHARPLMAVKEAVQIIRSMMATGSVALQGGIFRVEDASFNFHVSSHVPIFMAAQGPKMLRLAGEIGDGVLINASHPKDIEVALKHIREGASRAGRRMEDLELAAATSVSLARDAEEAKRAARTVVAYLTATCHESILQAHGIPIEPARRMRDSIMKGMWKGAYSQLTPEMFEAFSIVGTPDACIERVERLLRLGITLFIAGSPLGPNVHEAVGLIGGEVVPRFKRD